MNQRRNSNRGGQRNTMRRGYAALERNNFREREEEWGGRGMSDNHYNDNYLEGTHRGGRPGRGFGSVDRQAQQQMTHRRGGMRNSMMNNEGMDDFEDEGFDDRYETFENRHNGGDAYVDEEFDEFEDEADHTYERGNRSSGNTRAVLAMNKKQQRGKTKTNQSRKGRSSSDTSSSARSTKQKSSKKTTAKKSKSGKSRRGFASMDPEEVRRIASLGGRAAHEYGTAHEFTPREARAAGRKGGRARWS